MDYKDLSETIIKRSLKKGADAAEVYIQTLRQLEIQVRKGEIEIIQESVSNGLGVRVISKGKLAFASTNDLNDKAIDTTILRAIAFAQSTTPDENNVLPSEKESTIVEGLYDPKIFEIPTQEKISLIIKLEKLAMKNKRITKSDGAWYSEAEEIIYLANSNGLLKQYKSSLCGITIGVVAEKDEEKRSGYESCYRRSFSNLKPLEEIADKAAKKAFNMLNARQVKTQKAAVIFDPDVAYAILNGILTAINGEEVLKGASFL